MDERNCDNLVSLSKELVELFGKYINCSVYVSLIMEKTVRYEKLRTTDDKSLLFSKHQKIIDYL